MNWTQLLSTSRLGRHTQEHASSRSAFEQDYDRIIFSQPFRRLQDKTQVHPLPEQDFVHTRLTHSLEVSSVGRSLGRKTGETILQRHQSLSDQFSHFDIGAIVAAASLAHDLGNPPFGHAGEDAIGDFFRFHPAGKIYQERVTPAQWSDLISFEGNAQGFRLLTLNQYGLKLTAASLGAFTKYPCPALLPARDKSKKSQKKYGFFQTEREKFLEVASACGLHSFSDARWSRHPLAFLVEAADDICYSVIDLEDGCSLGLVSYSEAEELMIALLTRGKEKLGKLDHLRSATEKIGYLRALAISDLIEAVSEVFLENEAGILKGEFDKALVDVSPAKQSLEEIIGISVEKIYKSRHVVEIEASGHEVLPGLLEEFVAAGDHLLSPRQSRKYDNLVHLLPPDAVFNIRESANDTYLMLRNIIDFVSGMTDRRALGLYRQLKGFGRVS